jgi:hypothetical protein
MGMCITVISFYITKWREQNPFGTWDILMRTWRKWCNYAVVDGAVKVFAAALYDDPLTIKTALRNCQSIIKSISSRDI